ncbi:MAG: hypothetical protein D6820_11000 [Lentisphaerae bacterium]|nr:MAG: hypothetical protein D6820_11000 [Lentisphaerota bacterium]
MKPVESPCPGYTIGREDLDLKEEQKRTLETPHLKAPLILKLMFITFDLLYGKKCTLPKVKVLEILARYPYWAWENGAYLRITKLYARPEKVNKEKLEHLLELLDYGRDAQDNEQFHLLLLEDIIHQKGIKLGWFRHYFLPRFMALNYYYLSRLIYFINPAWSFFMNAAFESHAEHEYMKMSKEHPEWDDEPVDSVFFKKYPRQKTLGDLIRRIGLDERDHMNHSLFELKNYYEGKHRPDNK